MSWLEPDNNDGTEQENETMAKKFFTTCLLILLGLVALAWAVELIVVLAPWLIGLAVIAGGAYWLVKSRLNRGNRW